jgi:hypothetical protein
LMLVVFLVYMALALLASTLARTNGTAVGLAFLALILVAGLGAIPRLAEYLPGKLFGWGTSLILGSPESAWTALGVSAGIIIAALVAAIIIFRRQEV